MDNNKINESLRWGLNITDQEISEAIAIDLTDLKKDKETGKNSTLFGTICSGWWSNNWCE